MLSPIHLHIELLEITNRFKYISIAETFAVTCETALELINVLNNLCFLEFRYCTKEIVRLTLAGKLSNLQDFGLDIKEGCFRLQGWDNTKQLAVETF